MYQLIEEYYPAFKAHLAAQGRDLPGYVQREFEGYLKCGRLAHGVQKRCRPQARVVARGGIEPPTRGFSVLTSNSQFY